MNSFTHRLLILTATLIVWTVSGSDLKAQGIEGMPEELLDTGVEMKRGGLKGSEELKMEQVAEKGWPVNKVQQQNFTVRNVFIDPRKNKPPKVKKVVVKNPIGRVKSSVNRQTAAWRELSKLTRVASVLSDEGDAIVLLKVIGSPTTYTLKQGAPTQLKIKGSQNRNKHPMPGSFRSNNPGSFKSNTLILETITLKLVKVASHALYIQIEEINGLTFFADEQPIWAYEYSLGKL